MTVAPVLEGPRQALGEAAPGGRAPRVGVDLCEVAAVRRSVERFGHRYLRRVFTDHEAECCRSDHDPTGYDPGSLAARFAAKEAALKVLRPAGAIPEWRSIEVRRHPEGWCSLALSGQAAAQALASGISELAVSLSHEGPVAAAVVCGWAETDG
ncbi:MAG TPA: 4'-phosphopantetheinyl transferase superfamily protein [Acidimicrobiales bacterium]|nr:4'-phosphopantetheinyl transferase superfamily protein [Acidimicrobiales bacterium]